MTLGAILKQFLPRGLYGRAALILILPIVTIQLVVSSVFLQRHFDGVTRQMTNALSLELGLIVSTWDSDGRAAADALARDLEVTLSTDNVVRADDRYFYDLSGVVVIEVLRSRLDGVLAVDLRDNERTVQVAVAGPDGTSRQLTVTRRRASAAAPHQLLVIMLTTGILMTLVAYVFLRNQLRPIRRLASAADAFGKGRRMEYHPSGATEVRLAGRAFLDMRGRIEEYLDQRTLMLSGVSHDLRTPLTRMRLAMGMMEEGPEQRDLVRDVDEMEALLNTFLDFVRGDALDDPQPTDAVALASDVVERARRGGAADPAGGTITFAPSPETADIMLRPVAVQRALGNLVGNALRYGTGEVAVSVALMQRSVRFTVEDNGPGIAADRREDALRPFIRLDAARNQNKGSGVGLGLAIAHDIARRHGGSLALGTSADLGGLRVDLTLPR